MKTARQYWIEHGQQLYMKLLHANFLRQGDLHSTDPMLDVRDFRRQYLDAATSIPVAVLSDWLNDAWRECLTASWLVALAPDDRFRNRMTELLLASEAAYQGQGLCIATARYCDQRAAEELVAYLSMYLPVGSREYDQEWAIGSLAWLDRHLGTNRAEQFLDSSKDWNLGDAGQVIGALNPMEGIKFVTDVMSFLDDLSVGMSDRQS